MKKVFIDTNVVLDYYLDREGFSDDAEKPSWLMDIIKDVHCMYLL
nr:hypothetical protein [Prevotella sp.]